MKKLLLMVALLSSTGMVAQETQHNNPACHCKPCHCNPCMCGMSKKQKKQKQKKQNKQRKQQKQA